LKSEQILQILIFEKGIKKNQFGNYNTALNDAYYYKGGNSLCQIVKLAAAIK